MQKVVERPTKESRVVHPNLHIEIVTVTPGMAQAWLDKNVMNRKARPNVVAAYTRAMMERRWTVSGDAIRFDTTGNLMDGQHRLMACVAADVPFTTAVIYNVPIEARETIDTNVVRTVGDTLSMSGMSNTNQTVATVRWLLMAKRGYGTARGLSGSQRLKITTQEVRRVLDDHPMLHACVVRVHNQAKIKGATISALAWVVYVAENYLDKAAEAAAFVEVFRTGIPSRSGCPAHAFRERALRMADARQGASNELMQVGLIHAWNLFADGTELSMFKIPSTPVWINGLDRKKIK